MPMGIMVKLNSLPYPSIKSILPYKNPRMTTLISKLSYPLNIINTLRFLKKSIPINCPLITYVTTKFL
jgi:hypothetical protein